MSTPAKVHSSEAIEAVRMALISFAAQVGDALTELSAEMRRMQEWLEHDRPRHWKMQIRKAGDMAHEAQQALHRCLMFPVANERPSCTEERTALKKAKARLEYCQDKEDKVRRWQQTIRHELFEYEGRISQLVRLVEVEVPQAIGVLNKILRNLEEYHAVKTRDPRTAYDDVAMARAIWDENGELKEDESEDGEAASAAGGGREEARDADVGSVQEGN
jgi:exonuclease VII large subunit